MGSAFRGSRNVVFAVSGRSSVLELPRADALALLDWLGLGRPEFGAIEVSVLLPLCRRRLWPERRNVSPLQRHVGTLATAIAASPDAVVHFG